MNWNQIIKVSLICLALSGCANNQNQIEWRPYKDIDGEIRQIRFVREITASEMVNENPDVNNFQGKAISLSANKENLLGHLMLLRNAQGYVASIFDLSGRSLNPKKATDMQLLSTAKRFDFYEFGQFRLTRARFSAKNSICRDFKGKNGVDLVMITNYYPLNSFTDFYSSLINVNLKHQISPTQIGYTPSFNGQDNSLQKQIRQQEVKYGKKLAITNVQEKASLLFNIICK